MAALFPDLAADLAPMHLVPPGQLFSTALRMSSGVPLPPCMHLLPATHVATHGMYLSLVPHAPPSGPPLQTLSCSSIFLLGC